MRRGDLEPGGPRARRFFRKEIGARLASALIPVAVGIVLAIGWNWAGTTRQTTNSAQPVLSPDVQVAVEQAAAQAWASLTPAATPSDSAWPAVPGSLSSVSTGRSAVRPARPGARDASATPAGGTSGGHPRSRPDPAGRRTGSHRHHRRPGCAASGRPAAIKTGMAKAEVCPQAPLPR